MATSGTKKDSWSLISLKKLVEETSHSTGKEFFESLTKSLAKELEVYGVWVTEYLKEQDRLRALAFWLNGSFVKEYEYYVKNTPCEPVIRAKELFHVPNRLIELFPDDPDLRPFGAVSYLGIPLKDVDNSIMGHLALLDQKPLQRIPEFFALFRIFASRATAEFRRLKAEKRVLENERKLDRLLNGAMDAIVEFNSDLLITQANTAALTTFKTDKAAFLGKPIKEFLEVEGLRKLTKALLLLESPESYLTKTWIQGHVLCARATGDSFPAEATLSKYGVADKPHFALYLRNVQDRIRTAEALKQLNVEASMLRERIHAHEFDEIIGQSQAILKALEEVRQVATADANVLLRGETGTGKELFARAIHKTSNRKDKPYIVLNCAALPAELIESELFGHVKGAFTGASLSREGRFLLANGGTLFLDEIGELPLSLQAKLLRVVQEGEFDPVGSSKTQKVNVRLIAATNRALEKEIEEGNFRQDLFYRLNVFPIIIPPLRERGKDVLLLAEAFINKFSRQTAKKIQPLSEASQQRLLAYSWPGNVRELQNIIERGVITAREGQVNILDLLPLTTEQLPTSPFLERILTEAELMALEKKNILLALEKTQGRISGKGGAAQLLQIPPTTLSSRIRKIGIKRSISP